MTTTEAEQCVVDPGVLGLKVSSEPVRDREDFTKRPVESDAEYAKYIQRVRENAHDVTRMPKLVAKTILAAWIAVKLACGVLSKFIADEHLVKRIVAVLGAIAALWKIRAPSKLNTQLPDGPMSLPILGAMIPVLLNFTNMHGFLLNTVRQINFQSTEIRMPGLHMMLLMDPRDREYLLKGHFSNFTKNLPGEANSFEFCFAELFGRGIFSVDGPEWKDHRKIASHLFSGNSLKSKMEKVFNKHGNALKKALKEHAEKNEVIDIQNHMQALVFDAFCEIAFGVSPNAFELAIKGQKLEFLVAFDYVQMYSAERLFLPPIVWTMLKFFRLGHERALVQHVKVFRDYIMPIVRARKQAIASGTALNADDDGGDMLSLYIAHAKELNQHYMLDDEYLFDVVANFMVAGRDTTSCSMTNFFRFLSTNPQAEETLLKELKEKASPVAHDADISLEVTREMPFASSCVNEAIRLLPPVADDMRFCNEDIVLPSGLKVTRGIQVHLPSLAIGRDPNLWHDPDSFLPDRWMIHANKPGGVRRPDEYVLPAFWGGPRLCLGHAMARFEMITFFAKICPNFRLVPIPNQSYELITGPVAFYRDGVRVKVEKRQ